MCIVRDDGSTWTPMAPGGGGGGNFTNGGAQQLTDGALIIEAGAGAAAYAAAQQAAMDHITAVSSQRERTNASPTTNAAQNSRAASTLGARPGTQDGNVDLGSTMATPQAPLGATTASNAGGTITNVPVTASNADLYLQQNPDVAQYYYANSGNKDFIKANPTVQDFAIRHYGQFGQSEIANGQRAPFTGQAQQTATSTGTDPATQTQTDTDKLITNLTNGFNQTITDLQTTNANLVTQINTSNTNLTNLITQMGTNFQTQTQDLISRFTTASANQAAAMAKALKDAQDSVGQKEKKPNYGKALDKNKQLNGSGLGSTALTGPGGVPAGSLTLGATSLLGGAA